MLTNSQKKYLFAIYSLGSCGRAVRSAEVAKIVGVSKPSTVKMTQRLIEEEYINKESYGVITLTEKGIKAANELYTPCVILKHFLEKEIGAVGADEDAINIVSHISDETLERLVEYILRQEKLRERQGS